jgi:RNA polymerase sigma factor (sigma-70 family)
MSVANEFERAIHGRLLAGDRAASADLAEAYLAPVYSRVRRRVRGVRDETLISDAVTDALLNYTEHPTKYDPDRMSLQSYLVMSAYRDVLNALERERRRRAPLQPLDAVAHLHPARNTGLEDFEVEVVNRLSVASDTAREALLRHVRETFPDARDRRLLQLILDGERQTQSFARILGIEDRPVADQRKIVKACKDRLKARLKRLGVKFRDQQTH